jgi:hypothetical protein
MKKIYIVSASSFVEVEAYNEEEAERQGREDLEIGNSDNDNWKITIKEITGEDDLADEELKRHEGVK